MALFTNQDTRLLTLHTPLGDDVLLLTGFTGQEALSRLFCYQLEMLSEDESLDPRNIVGKGVTWGVQHVDQETRWFHGIVSRFEAGSSRLRGRRAYRAEVVPYLWFLTRTANCRIFQNKTTTQILETVFEDYGLTDYTPRKLRRDYPKWEYCVQYRETAFQFVARLMEYEGIFWYFKHENGKHTLVLGDHKSAYADCAEKEVEYLAGSLAANHLDAWTHQYEFRTGRRAHTDYNFKTPSAPMLTTTKTLVSLPRADQWEVFDYPGAYPVKADGEVLTRIRMEEDEAAHDVVRASGRCCTFTPGGKFTLTEHEFAAEAGRDYVLTSVEHEAVDPSHGANGHPAEYRNSFTCIPAALTFRPPRQTPKPFVQGPQTAVVVGPKGEEIYTDEYGRIKVQFHWDREGQRDENSSCWVRVSQTYAGQGWGNMCVPRVGQEVVVDFLEGDPDRPLITGRVYNAGQMPPYELPAGKAVSGLMSRSTPGGGGYNEFIFDDSKGGELIRLHGQKDLDSTIENNLDEKVLNDRTRAVTNHETITIGGNRKESVKGKEEVSVGGTRTHTVQLACTETIGLAKLLTIGAGYNRYVHGGMLSEVVGFRAELVGAKKVVVIGGNLTEIVKANQNTTITGTFKEIIAGTHWHKVGGPYINASKSVRIQADTSITLTAGASTLTLKSDGTIELGCVKLKVVARSEADVNSAKISLDAGQDLKATANAQLLLQGGSFALKSSGGSGEVNAKAMLDIRGQMVNINC